MGNLIFRDSRTTRSKTLVMPTPQDDIVLNLPEESGILATTNTLSKKLINDEAADLISNILKPDITENNGGIINPDDHNKPLVRASYRTSPSFQGELEYTEWVASSDYLAKEILDKTDRLEYKDSWLPNISNPGMRVYVRYRFHSEKLRSPWSDPLIYKTPVYGVEPFNIVVTAGTMSPALIVSKFKAYGENLIGPINHTATTWKIYDGENVVYESLANTSDKLKHVVPYGYLKPDTNYKVEVFFHTDNRTFPMSKASYKMFTTPNIYISTPYVKYKYNGGNHSLEGSEFSIVGSPEPHVSTYWELYRIENGKKHLVYKKDEDRVNLTRLPITSMLFGRGLTYEVTIGYQSQNMSSKRFTTIFRPIDDLSDPITLNIEEDSDKLPILRISKFHVEGHTDNIKNFALRVRSDVHGIDKVETLFNIPNTYNTDIVRKLTPTEYISWFENSNYVLNSMPYFDVSGYYVGEKFNSPMGKTNFLPTIRANTVFNILAKDHTSVIINATTNVGTATWLNIGKRRFTISGGHLVEPVVIERNDWEIELEEQFGLQYAKDYKVSLIVETEIGSLPAGEATFRLYQGKINAPTVSAKWDIEGISQPRLYISGSPYIYDKPEIPGSGYRETEIRVLKGTEVIAETKSEEPIGGWIKLPKSKFPKLDWNTTYKIEMKYVAHNGIKSPAGELEYSLPVKPAIAVGIPVINANVEGKKITLMASGWSITGVEDKTHKATDWYVYENNVLLWSSLNDTTNLTSIIVPETIIELGHTYDVQVAFIGVSDIKSDKGSKSVPTVDKAKKAVIDSISGKYTTLGNSQHGDLSLWFGGRWKWAAHTTAGEIEAAVRAIPGITSFGFSYGSGGIVIQYSGNIELYTKCVSERGSRNNMGKLRPNVANTLYKNGSLYNPVDGWTAGSIEGSDAHLFMAILWKNPITGVIEWPKYPNI